MWMILPLFEMLLKKMSFRRAPEFHFILYFLDLQSLSKFFAKVEFLRGELINMNAPYG